MLKPKFYITQKCRQKLPDLKSCIIMNSHEQSILELQVGGRYHIETNPLICGGRYHIETSPFTLRRPLSYRNQSIRLRSKSMDWFLYDNGLRHERVKIAIMLTIPMFEHYKKKKKKSNISRKFKAPVSTKAK